MTNQLVHFAVWQDGDKLNAISMSRDEDDLFINVEDAARMLGCAPSQINNCEVYEMKRYGVSFMGDIYKYED